ncbi:alpha/beta hydrolase [Actinocrispum sp. NPDC049592]|uniref:alpha/beta hydrolase n=1 Tax=Actinocrispum sp. NPDC049592 TaxID=3154835 RepID=UPI003428FD8F
MRKIVQVSTIAAVAASLVTLPVAQAAGTNLTWRPCGTQECATVRVPMDYDHPGAQQISLAVSRIRTADPKLRRGVLLIIPGGPGNSGLSKPSAVVPRLPKDVKDRYDIVGFDPRGVGASTPVSCALTPEDADPKTFLPFPAPDGDISANVAKAERVAQACVRNGGELMRHINTRNEARDIDQIRKALGERKLSYWGTSYGTYAGATYAQLFPGNTDRVVLDSNDDPNPKLVARQWARNFGVGGEDRFPDFAAWAAARVGTYDLGSTPAEVRATYMSLAAQYDRAPTPSITGNYLRTAMFQSMYGDSAFPLLAATLQAAKTGTEPPVFPVPPTDQFQNTMAVSVATVCNDVAWPRDVSYYQREVLANRKAYPLTNGMPANIFPCAFWPANPAPAVRITPNGPDNVLLVQNLRDPATPYSGALKLLDAFGHRARMVTVNSGGHDSYLANGNACGDAAVTDFLVNGTHRTTHC